MTESVFEKSGGLPDSGWMPPETRKQERGTQPDIQDQSRRRRWTSLLSQVASEDIIDIGDGRCAHFRRDRRFAQMQVVFTAPEGVDPDPGRELTDQFKELGWTRHEQEPGKPWVYQLEKPSGYDPTARGDSCDVLHEQFLIIVNEHREKHGMPPTIGWRNLLASDTTASAANHEPSDSTVTSHAAESSEAPKPQSTKQEARGGQGRGAAGQAAVMLDAFASVGAERFDLTFTDAAGDKAGFRTNRTLGQLRSAIPAILQEATERKHNVIVRPRSTGAVLIQLDDLGENAVERLRPVSFLVLRTSPGNFQAWVAVSDGDTDFARRLRNGAGADLTASGATRVSGSLNFKAKYAPTFPVVETVHIDSGKVVTGAELEALGVVAAPEKPSAASIPHSRHRSSARGWPNYQRCVGNAPPAREGGRPDISRADFTFCLLALDWGWGIEETAAKLMQVSDKAKAEGEAYTMRTARAAARVVDGRGGRQR